MDLDGLKVVVLGAGDIGSAVAHRLFRGACAVVIHEDPKPTTTRRGMAFADAVFDGRTSLDGIDAVRARDIAHSPRCLGAVWASSPDAGSP
jgi:lactate dehydrogenase-like 2-hydroxyacid dehydrogenase